MWCSISESLFVLVSCAVSVSLVMPRFWAWLLPRLKSQDTRSGGRRRAVQGEDVGEDRKPGKLTGTAEPTASE